MSSRSIFNRIMLNQFHLETCQSQLAMFYFPMHAVCKDASTTSKLRVVFKASSTVVSLNNRLLIGPCPIMFSAM